MRSKFRSTTAPPPARDRGTGAGRRQAAALSGSTPRASTCLSITSGQRVALGFCSVTLPSRCLLSRRVKRGVPLLAGAGRIIRSFREGNRRPLSSPLPLTWIGPLSLEAVPALEAPIGAGYYLDAAGDPMELHAAGRAEPRRVLQRLAIEDHRAMRNPSTPSTAHRLLGRAFERTRAVKAPVTAPSADDRARASAASTSARKAPQRLRHVPVDPHAPALLLAAPTPKDHVDEVHFASPLDFRSCLTWSFSAGRTTGYAVSDIGGKLDRCPHAI
jgi:hypothetical protein